MGHRTNYAIREDGNVRLFYSHWGALTVPQDVFWGPEAAEAFISQNEEIPNSQWLDDVWGEGGVALDKDTKTIALFGGESLGYEPLQPVFARLMAALWKQFGWTVRWVESMPDICEQVGVPREVAESEPIPVSTWDVPDNIDRFEREGFFCGIISVAGEDGWFDRVISYTTRGVACVGPSLLEGSDGLPTIDMARERHEARDLEDWEAERPPFGDAFSGGLVIDPEERELHVWEFLLSGDLEAISTAWTGWSVLTYHGLSGHFEITGRELPDTMPVTTASRAEDEEEEKSDEECLAEIARVLFEGERSDPSDLVRKLMEEREEDDVRVNPSALMSPVDARPDAASRRELFDAALAGMVHE